MVLFQSLFWRCPDDYSMASLGTAEHTLGIPGLVIQLVIECRLWDLFQTFFCIILRKIHLICWSNGI